MFEIIKKSLIITKNNPILVLGFVIYYIILSLVVPKLAVVPSGPLAIVMLFAILMLNAAFFAGWFQMIKSAIANSKKKYTNEEEKFYDAVYLRKDFFEAIPGYIIPVSSFIVLYYLLFWMLLFFGYKFATHFIGSIGFLRDVLTISQPEQMIEFFNKLTQDEKIILYGWKLFFALSIGLFGLLTIFWPAAIYYGKGENGSSKNPFLALWYSITAIFRRPLGVIGLNLFIGLLIMISMPLGLIFSLNPVSAFIYMVFSIYFFVFMVVLIFSYYAERLVFYGGQNEPGEPGESDKSDNSDNGPDGIGQEQSGD